MPNQRSGRDQRRRLAILTNIISPYRIPLFQYLSEKFQTLILVSGGEDNRGWSQTHAPNLRTKVAWGVTIRGKVTTTTGGTAEQKYLHLNPGYAWDLVRFRPDAVITTEMGLRSVIGVLYGLLFNVPVWLWWEGGLHTSRLHGRSVLRRGLRRLFFARRVRRWLSFGDVSTEYLTSLGVPRRRILQVQNAVDDQQFTVEAQPFALDLPRPRALFVGRLIENKGIYPLLEATAAIQRAGIPLSLVVVGDGPETERFDAMAAALGVTAMQRIPWIPPESMPAIYRACDFLILPTFDDVWGLVVSEALLSGLPAISSVYAGCTAELLPAENRFDPFDREGFVETYRRAAQGRIAAADPSRVQPIRDVASRIATDVSTRTAETRPR